MEESIRNEIVSFMMNDDAFDLAYETLAKINFQEFQQQTATKLSYIEVFMESLPSANRMTEEWFFRNFELAYFEMLLLMIEQSTKRIHVLKNYENETAVRP